MYVKIAIEKTINFLYTEIIVCKNSYKLDIFVNANKLFNYLCVINLIYEYSTTSSNPFWFFRIVPIWNDLDE